jgi:hypothetical protein
MSVRRFPLLIVPVILFLAIIACKLNVGGPAYPDQHIPVSTEAAGELESALQTAVAAGMETGQETLVISEPQLTSYMATRLATQEQPFFTNPQVYLQNGQIQVYGTAQQGYFQANIRIILAASVDEQGQPRIEIKSADFGPLPVPAGLNDITTAVIQEAYTGTIGPIATGFRLESITVADGNLTIVGRTK